MFSSITATFADLHAISCSLCALEYTINVGSTLTDFSSVEDSSGNSGYTTSFIADREKASTDEL